MDDFAGQTVCVVGGTAGIGLAIAQGAAARGAAVIVVGRDVARTAQTAESLGPAARGLAADATNADDIDRLFAQLGQIDHLAVTAAQVRSGPIKNGALDDARFTFDGKFWPQFMCVRRAEVRQSILLCSGVLSRRPWSGTAAIAAVNGAVEALGRALAIELAPVRVNVLSPGLVQGTRAYEGMPEEAQAAMFAAAAGRLPTRLVGDAQSVAAPALGLMASAYATGIVLDVDGGGLLT